VRLSGRAPTILPALKVERHSTERSPVSQIDARTLNRFDLSQPKTEKAAVGFADRGDVADLRVAIVRRDRIRCLGVAGIVLGATLGVTDD
jgi:hypothetical protein